METRNQASPQQAEVVSDAFRAAMTRMATPVAVVTSDGPAGRVGLTVSSSCLLSQGPPMYLACVHKRSPANDIIRGNGVFRVNLLATSHDHVSDTFAGRPWPGKEPWDFSCGDWDVQAEAGPLLNDALATIACRLDSVVSAGTHWVYMGEVFEADSRDADPLIYLPHRYYRLEEHEPSTFVDYPEAKPPYETKRTAQ